METKKVVIVIFIIIPLIIISSIAISNPFLVDRAFYRMGFQEQICFPNSDDVFQSDNVTNIAVAADFGVTKNSVKTLENIHSSNPEVVLIPGDLSYSTAEEWIEFTEFMGKTNIYIASGDAEPMEEKEKLLEYYGLNNNYYSFDYENVHFLSIDTTDEKNEWGIISDDKMQLNFIRTDLSHAYNDPEIDFTIVIMHLPMYSSRDGGSFMDMRNELQPIFDLYGVDLVLNGHRHAYERTYPVMFNNTVTDNEDCSYDDPDGQIYVTIGTGGASHSPFKLKHPWSVVQNHNDYGFLNIKLLNDGKTLYGEFVSNTGKVMDAFQINLNDNSIKNSEDEN